jgi:hypothetical protein
MHRSSSNPTSCITRKTHQRGLANKLSNSFKPEIINYFLACRNIDLKKKNRAKHQEWNSLFSERAIGRESGALPPGYTFLFSYWEETNK